MILQLHIPSYTSSPLLFFSKVPPSRKVDNAGNSETVHKSADLCLNKNTWSFFRLCCGLCVLLVGLSCGCNLFLKMCSCALSLFSVLVDFTVITALSDELGGIPFLTILLFFP